MVRAVLRDRTLRRLQYALLGSVLGRFGFVVALGVWAYREGGAGLVGLAGFIRLAPGALVAPFAAPLVDRFPRERLMAASDLVRALLFALAAGAVAAGLPVVVLVLVGLASLAGAVFEPARAALMPSLVDTAKELTAANAVGSGVNSTGYFLGPALGGLLLVATSVQVVFAATAGALVWSAVNVMLLRPRHVEEPVAARGEGAAESAAGLLAEVREGFGIVGRDRGVSLLMSVFFLQTLIAGAVSVIVVVLALEQLRAGQAWVGYLEAASGIGALAGAVLVAQLFTRLRLSTATLAGLVLWGIPLLLVAFVDAKAAALAAMVLIGIGDTAIDVSGITLLQRVVPEALLGRVFGLLETVLIAGLALGALLAPVLISAAGFQAAVTVFALLPVPVLLAIGLLRRLDDRAQVPERPRALLRALEMFKPLTPPAVDVLALKLNALSVQAGEPVFSQGDIGDRFYVVDEGTVQVLVDGDHVRDLGPGDVFGEIALLRDVPRTASIFAGDGGVELFALDRADFLAAVTGQSGALSAADSLAAARLARRAPAALVTS
jgi:CRP-like cAMP-binding protein/predicted MFS family arabinose efflux permease